ncbi:MAG: hypothetical protein WDA53_05385 [Bacillota bacterium]
MALLIVGLLLLSACAKQTVNVVIPSQAENGSVSFQSAEPITPLDAEMLSAYKAVLQNNFKFFNTDENKYMDINQFADSFNSATGTALKFIEFAFVDLDNDGTPEVILWEQVSGNDYGFEVLSYQDKIVYGYTFYYRGFNQLKADGTFYFSSAASDGGFGTVKFSKNTYSIDKVTYSQSHVSNGNPTVLYFVNRKSATRGEFDLVIRKQDEKPDATWYDFTDENIETVFFDA